MRRKSSASKLWTIHKNASGFQMHLSSQFSGLLYNLRLHLRLALSQYTFHTCLLVLIQLTITMLHQIFRQK